MVDTHPLIHYRLTTHCNRCQGSLYVQKKTTQWGGWGVHASRPFPKGSIVLSSSLLQSNDTSCSHSIQIDWNQHIMMDLPARFLNHSCDANVGVMRVANEGGSYDFVALREIESGDVSVGGLLLLCSSAVAPYPSWPSACDCMKWEFDCTFHISLYLSPNQHNVDSSLHCNTIHRRYDLTTKQPNSK